MDKIDSFYSPIRENMDKKGWGICPFRPYTIHTFDYEIEYVNYIKISLKFM